MAIAVTQSDFRRHMKQYLDEVDDNDETLYIARSHDRTVAVISQEKLKWLERLAKAEDGSTKQKEAKDKLIALGVLSK
ncbi:type II toxin-antitoxin system Phd/YefM family antitoxin [Lactobacillus sp. ESL0681]|uniref:type II toxin-antitoxin system Phd/YefM family antitoxin n=1 Tax=Lactobacillus sp. ESL0681 TaxID=2983211 RepID=UPI0023F9744C|nr:type II toxin-antitoxin system Phd/YefM family antitoxin [Lactobacillus sp. ESL0681]WEV41319.1 type II toxin-antitoxin system Phd/YefM family antitoxin [Lactobacillus sp. ESL0681]